MYVLSSKLGYYKTKSYKTFFVDCIEQASLYKKRTAAIKQAIVLFPAVNDIQVEVIHMKSSPLRATSEILEERITEARELKAYYDAMHIDVFNKVPKKEYKKYLKARNLIHGYAHLCDG